MRAEIEQAVALLRRGDDEALEQALALLQNTVFSFSMRVCGQREDAEDTMQEVLVKSVPYLPKFGSPKALLVWIYKVAKNRCLMNRRRSKFAPSQELSLEELMPDRKKLEELGADGSVNPEMFAIRSQEAASLRDAIHRLPPAVSDCSGATRYEGIDRRRSCRDYWTSPRNGSGAAAPGATVRAKRADEGGEATSTKSGRRSCVASCRKYAVAI